MRIRLRIVHFKFFFLDIYQIYMKTLIERQHSIINGRIRKALTFLKMKKDKNHDKGYQKQMNKRKIPTIPDSSGPLSSLLL